MKERGEERIMDKEGDIEMNSQKERSREKGNAREQKSTVCIRMLWY